MKKLTVFTPTYNRGNNLIQLYNSLIEQQSRDFEWLIVDDGSKDNTADVVMKFKQENKISIKYIYQENKGKHCAFNNAIENANSEIFICVDSDDYLEKGSIEIILQEYKKIENIDNICGIAGLCRDKKNNVIGGKYKDELLLSDTIEIRDKYKKPGEPEVYKNSILKKYRFEEFDNEKFITEAVLFDKLTSVYKVKYINKVLMVKEYLVGGLTDNQLKIRLDSIQGTIYYYNQRIKLSHRLRGRLKASINYSRFCLHNNEYRRIYKSNSPFVTICVLPIAIIMILNDKIVFNNKYKKVRR